jgi:hypothetical protein
MPATSLPAAIYEPTQTSHLKKNVLFFWKKFKIFSCRRRVDKLACAAQGTRKNTHPKH